MKVRDFSDETARLQGLKRMEHLALIARFFEFFGRKSPIKQQKL